MSTVAEGVKLAVKGHVKIIDQKTGEILLDKDNAVHHSRRGSLTGEFRKMQAKMIIRERASFSVMDCYGRGLLLKTTDAPS